MSTDLKARKSLTERKMRLRKSKIVCTIGPSSCSREALFELCDRGMNVARLNMSHGDHESHKQVIGWFPNTFSLMLPRVVTFCDIACFGTCYRQLIKYGTACLGD
jgi:ABC-type phosphate transport system ATPase subunit